MKHLLLFIAARLSTIYDTRKTVGMTILLALLGMGLPGSSDAQRLSPEVVASDGGTAQSDEMSLAWTLGEPASESLYSDRRIYTEGFHQPVLRVEPVYEPNPQKQISVSGNPGSQPEAGVYPNPVQGMLIIEWHQFRDTEVVLLLSDVYGRLLMQRAIDPLTQSAQIDMSRYVDGLYLLIIRDAVGESMKSFKVIKSQ